ncbi:MAG: lysophospholipid acyltransferase family protein [Phycisphaerae bacterium]|jgi:KDO2-lipid IV(A) lauroyltransferase
MARVRNKYVDYLQYLGLRLFAMFVHMAEPETNYRTARWIGRLMYRFDRKHRRIAIGHLRLSFPDWDEARLNAVARTSMENLVCLGMEVLQTTRLITPMTWRKHVRLKNLGPALRLLLERKTGVIFVTGHYGNFEVAGYTMATLGFPSVSVARPLDNPYINDHIMGVREKTGQSILYKKGATGSMEDVLEGRGALSFIADQDAGRKGLFVDFFGRPASTYKSVALMAMKFGAPIVVGYGRRLDDKFHFEMGVDRIIYPHEWADKDDPLCWTTQEFTHALEQIVRGAPEQYFWVHRRWKHRPGGQAPGPDGVA